MTRGDDWDIDGKLKDSLIINFSAEVPERLKKAFCEATKIISTRIEKPKTVNAFFCRGRLIVELIEPRYAEYWKDVIIFDINKIEQVNDDRLVMVIFLEELVHAYLDILDEIEVSFKVAELYSVVTFNKNTMQYEIIANHGR